MQQRSLQFIRAGYERFLEAQQVRMSTAISGLPLLAILGVFCGLLAGGVIVLFRLGMDAVATRYFTGQSIENFAAFSASERFLLCVAGGLVVGILLQLLKPKARNVGVVHVLERLDYHQGHLPLRNAVVQFIGASLALLSGQSVGREGPSVHIGAAAGSILGRSLRIPNNSVRILVGCGVAAAIAAAFNTPLAGVIFAMEVVIMEYTVMGFTPVILSAVSATSLTRVVFGGAAAFTIPEFGTQSLWELSIVAIMGVLVGCVAALFIQMTLFMNSLFERQPIWLRVTIAGVITGTIALLVPQIMGTGYDTVNNLLLAKFGLIGLGILLMAKLIATASAVGLGVPAGLIGPSLFIGATAGGLVGFIAQSIIPGTEGASFYALLGMAAMMAATLQAPLAALIFLLELTTVHSIILPGMSAVVIASLITRVVFKKSSIYRHLMLARGLDYRNTPISNALRRIGVASVMERNIIQREHLISISEARSLLTEDPRWILLKGEDQRLTSLLPAADLAFYLTEQEEHTSHAHEQIDLLKIPAKRVDAQPITIVASLQEAHETMQRRACEVLFITGAHGATRERIYGVITREHIDRSYQS